MTKQELKQMRYKISANESRLWDCLNEAVDLLFNNCTDFELKKADTRDIVKLVIKAKDIYESKGFSSLPFFNQQRLINNYLK